MDQVELFGTLGPSCCEEPVLEAMFRAGMNGCRLNLSHTSLEMSTDWISAFHTAADRAQVKEPQLLIDLEGPELRIGMLASPLSIADGESIPVPMPGHVLASLRIKDEVLLDDGKLEATVRKISNGSALLAFSRGGRLSSRKSIKIEGRSVQGPFLTPADKQNLAIAGSFGVTAVMEPFVTGPEALHAIRKELDQNGLQDVRIFAKIENREGVEALSAIMKEADLVVIARGDLGNDVPFQELPLVQKDISKRCRNAGCPFMVVTQMLTSMEHSKVPTRAELTDICNAVLDGASALMVTNETAVGDYPALVIRVLAETAKAALKARED